MVFKAGVGVFGSKLKPTDQGIIEVVVNRDSALFRVGTATQYITPDRRVVYKIILDRPEDASRLDTSCEGEFILLENGEFKRMD